MKHSCLLLALLFAFGRADAKKVKFSVDMTGQTVSTAGLHIVGDFQSQAGLGANWDPATASLTKEGNTNIYSIVVAIPAFRVYQYRFVNGDQTYDAEFVPEESRVGYIGADLVDNRWLYVDSLANDTAFAGAILYGANAPAGKMLVRYRLNTNHMGVVPANGFHVSVSYQSYDAAQNRLYAFSNGVFEIINYVSAGTYGYVYINGNTSTLAETVPGSCAVSGKRSITVSKDTVLTLVCFGECADCQDVGIAKYGSTGAFKLYPNPVINEVTIEDPGFEHYTVSVINHLGQLVYSSGDTSGNTTLTLTSLPQGIYEMKLSKGNLELKSARLLKN